jgi:hypothetical protein
MSIDTQTPHGHLTDEYLYTARSEVLTVMLLKTSLVEMPDPEDDGLFIQQQSITTKKV